MAKFVFMTLTLNLLPFFAFANRSLISQKRNLISFVGNSPPWRFEQTRAKYSMASTSFDISDNIMVDDIVPKIKYIKRQISVALTQEAVLEKISCQISREVAQIEAGVLAIETNSSSTKLMLGPQSLSTHLSMYRPKLLLSISKGAIEVESNENIFCSNNQSGEEDQGISSKIELTLTIFGEERKGQRHQGAKHVVNDFREPDEFSEMREEAIRNELEKIGIDPEDLFEDEFIGTPPLRTYRTFIRPRQKKLKKVASEPIERAAARTAHQIAFLMRHHQATQADYFRNSDIVMDAAQQEKMTIHPIKIILDNLRSAYNVGSIFRTSETAGVAEVITCGITPTSKHPKITKTACSATQNVKSRHFMNTKEAVNILKEEGYKVYAMETTAHSQKYTDVKFPEKTAFVLGNEVTGVDISVLKMCDSLIEIPTFGMKNSLNVASACPIVVYELIRQWSV